MEQGWIKLHRSLLDWEWYDDANTIRIFLHLLLTANHEDKKWHGIDIKRGEKITSLANISEELGISIQSVRTSLDKLISTQALTRHQQTKYTHISINNYGKYQESNTITNNLVTRDQHDGNNKQEGKNEIMKRSIYTSLDSLTENEFETIAGDYKVPISLVRSSYDDLKNYCSSKNRRYSNYFSALRNFTKSNAIKTIKEAQSGKHSIDARDL